MVNIKLDLQGKRMSEKLALVNNVAATLEGSTVFPAPPVSAAQLKALGTELEDAIAAAMDGSRAARAARNAVLKRAEEALRQVADYVRMVAQGDAVKLTQSGFALTRDRKPLGIVGTPLLTTARMTGRPGEADLRWTGVRGRRVYHVYVTEQDPALPGVEWTLTGVTSRTRFVADSLVPYKAYWFCVSAIGSAGEGVKSDPVIARAA